MPRGRGHGHDRRLDRDAIERIREEGLEIAGVLAVVDRLAGGGERIEAAAEAPYRPWSRSTRSTRSAPTAAEARMEPDAVEIRVLGCLVEKQRTTPDVYPLSLNALRLACNQSTNRDPVVDYDEATVVEALRRLALRGWTRLASGAGSRARKYRHLLAEALGLDDAEVSLLAVLMLRGAQTPGELEQRSERLHGFADLGAVQETLDRLVERGSSPATSAGRARRRTATSSCSAAAARSTARPPRRRSTQAGSDDAAHAAPGAEPGGPERERRAPSAGQGPRSVGRTKGRPRSIVRGGDGSPGSA